VRAATLHYQDPLDRVWTECALRVGLRLKRSEHAYATTDGKGLLELSTDLDGDDCLAQLIFHELCHSLVQGDASFALPDWGLDNQSDRDVPQEHACLRVQALLSRPYGLGAVLAPTTDFRAFYDALGDDPLSTDESSLLARRAAARSTSNRWGPHLHAALKATEDIVRTAARYAGPLSLFAQVQSHVALHASGFPLGTRGQCGGCAWRSVGGSCAQAKARMPAELPACERFELALDCRQCGACCREGYDAVEIGVRDPVRKKHPELVTLRDGRLGMAREGSRCAALSGDGVEAPHVCRIYSDRPKPCRELAVSSTNCLIARRRVGLSR
jgi:hypothetical protein